MLNKFVDDFFKKVLAIFSTDTGLKAIADTDSDTEILKVTPIVISILILILLLAFPTMHQYAVIVKRRKMPQMCLVYNK